jgi:hypothetical protein
MCSQTPYKKLSHILLTRLSPYIDEIAIFGIINVELDVTDQLLIRFPAFVSNSKKWEYNGSVPQLFIYFKNAYDSVSREV